MIEDYIVVEILIVEFGKKERIDYGDVIVELVCECDINKVFMFWMFRILL